MKKFPDEVLTKTALAEPVFVFHGDGRYLPKLSFKEVPLKGTKALGIVAIGFGEGFGVGGGVGVGVGVGLLTVIPHPEERVRPVARSRQAIV